ncbi:RluA family pseudouridine synthase [Reinekea blandensis]|uniref:Pseudouridine synthase n=1 Tax=Reinekea blandensis MED297 TaxID=314283 RepID=A4BA12_9GAMM|nr:RluA family pseudouridine synthase [Reinekea blandensis]EAR11463.1 putative 23S rRNA pseudouridylate 746 synthase [Reinekea sp. MED297] [Reinekea blandensis MED297]
MARNIQDTFIAPPCLDDIEIVHEDDALLVINKPSGLLALSGKDPRNRDSVHARLVKRCPSIRMIHRLDFGTSGLMVLAKSKTMATTLNRQFQQREVTKVYQAILWGQLANASGRINAHIARDDENFPKMRIGEGGKPAQTDYQVLVTDMRANTSTVEFYPRTGRTHQLRIHSAHIGHPILGCDIYGTQASTQAASRLLLHATELTLKHPETDQLLRFQSPRPF